MSVDAVTYPHDLNEDVLRILRNQKLVRVGFAGSDGEGLEEDVDP